MRLPDELFTLEELRAVVALLAGPGVVWQLEFGDFVLLQPERINAYAFAVIRSVRAHSDEIGCIWEERVLKGELDYQDMKRLPHHDEFAHPAWPHLAHLNWPHLMLIFCLGRSLKSSNSSAYG